MAPDWSYSGPRFISVIQVIRVIRVIRVIKERIIEIINGLSQNSKSVILGHYLHIVS